MIISHAHRFIFIKTRKTAGTSVERALAPLCGPEDVITRDHLHAGEDDVLAPYARNTDPRWNPVRELMGAPAPLDVVRTVRDWARRPTFYNHMPARSVRDRIPREVWEGYYTFAFERNPWDKCVSFFHWQHRHGPPPMTFDAWLTAQAGGRTADQALPTDWRRYASGDDIIVDDVFDFGDLQGNLGRALANTGLADAEVTLPHLKGDTRRRDEAFSPAGHAVVLHHFAREIAHLGYDCPDRYRT